MPASQNSFDAELLERLPAHDLVEVVTPSHPRLVDEAQERRGVVAFTVPGMAAFIDRQPEL